MIETQPCCFSGCAQPAAAPVDTRSFCAEHFVAACDAQLDAYRRQLEVRPFPEATVESLAHFLAECTRQATHLAGSTGDFSGGERTRLLEVLTRAAELGRHLRRSPRKFAAIPVWLRREGAGRTWEEETETQVLSRYGAALECRHFVEPGGTLAIVRRDNGQRANGRVTYCRYTPGGHREVGLEFINCDNFWNLDWIPPAGASSPETLSVPFLAAPAKDPADQQKSGKRRTGGQHHAFAEVLAEQERQLWQAIRAKDVPRLAVLLADEFLWVGSDGIKTKPLDPEMLPAVHASELPLEDLVVRKLNKATAVVTFGVAESSASDQPEAASRAVHHTSVWVHRGGKWQLVLHQETPVGQAFARATVAVE